MQTVTGEPGNGRTFVEEDLAQIVHDLKNPLSAIALEAELMAMWLGSGERTRCVPSVARIQGNVDYLDRIVHDLLDLCAVAAGRLTLRFEPVALGALIGRVVERLPGRARDRVSIDVGPQIVVRVDEVRIERVVANLVDNALRYSPDTCRVSVALARAATHARVTVSDTGPGIAADELDRLFERFRRGHSTAGRAGSGLGLYTCKRIVDAHAGRIGVESVQCAGARFWFELPV